MPPDTDGYFEVIKSPIDYSTIQSKLEGGAYGDDPAAAFAADVRLLVSNAVTYSPETDNDCHKAAKANLSAFETAFLEGLATDGGAAAEAAKEGIKRASVTRKRGRE